MAETKKIIVAVNRGANTAAVIKTPEIIIPNDSQTNFINLIKSTEYKTSEYFYGKHQATDWEVSTDPTFSTVDISSHDNTVNLTSFPLVDIITLTTYYVRVRYKSDNYISEWSKPVSFVTPDVFVKTPEITVQGEPNNVLEIPIVTCSEFTVIGGNDKHKSTDWTIKDCSGNIVWSSLQDTVNLTSIRIPNDVLKLSTVYIFEVVHRGYKYTSSVNSKIATTADVFSIVFDVFKDSSCAALFEFEDNANDTGGVYSGKWLGASNYENGKIGLAASFDGHGLVRLSRDIYDARIINYPIAISAWVYLKAGETDAVVYNTGGTWNGLGFGIRSNKIYGAVQKRNKLDTLYGNAQLENDVWYFLTMVFDGSTKGMKLYVNGELDASKTMVVYPGGRSHFPYIGGVKAGQNTFYDHTNAHYTRCVIDNIRFFKRRLLTDSEVRFLYNEGM